MAFGKTPANYSTSDSSGVVSELKRRLQQVVSSVTITAYDQYCLYPDGTLLYSYPDSSSPSQKVEGRQPMPVLRRSDNGFEEVTYSTVGKYWVPVGSYECLTQAKVNAALKPLAIQAVTNFFNATTISPYQATQILEDSAKFNTLVGNIVRSYLNPLIRSGPGNEFFKLWRLA
jgi:hypothetical protein